MAFCFFTLLPPQETSCLKRLPSKMENFNLGENYNIILHLNLVFYNPSSHYMKISYKI